MATVGEAYVKIIPDASGFSSALKGEVDGALKNIDKSVRQTTDQIEDEFDKAAQESGKAMKGVGDQIKEVGKTIATAFVTKQVADFAKSSIKAASDLNESINAVQVTFGDASDGIIKFGETASKTVGLSAKDFNGFAVQFAGFTKQIAGANGDIVQVTTELTTRIADFASVMNLDIPQAAQVFQSSLAGETESIRRFGIDLSAAAVELYALESGLIASKDEMTEGIKVQARYGLLMQETQKTAGDFANTSDSLANRQRILSAEMENLRARVGEGLLPAMESLANVAGVVLEGFGKLPRGIQDVIVQMSLLFAGTALLKRNLANLGIESARLDAAIRGVRFAFAGLLIAQGIGDVLNQMSDASGNLDRKLQALQIALGDLKNAAEDTQDPLEAFRDLVAAEGKKFNLSNIFKDVGKEITIIGGSIGRDIEYIDQAFDKLLKSSPEMAKRLLEAWRAQTESLDQNSQQYEDNIMLIERYEDRLGLTTGATDALTGATNDMGDAQGDTARETQNLNDKLKEQEDRLKKATDAAISSFNTEIRVERAKRDTNDAVAKYNELVKSMETGTYKGSDAFRDLAESSEEVYESALDQAAAIAQLATEQAIARGETEESIDKSGLFKDALLQVALTLDPSNPLRRRLFEYINELSQIPSNINTYVNTVFTQTGQEYVVTPYGASLVNPPKTGSPPKTSTPPKGMTPAEIKKEQELRRKLAGGPFANGGIITGPTYGLMGEAGPEVVIPLTRRARALELMRETGLDAMVGSRRATVSIDTAVFNNGTDANLVAQKVNAAERARSFST